ncbi:MAG: nucleotidyltransferase family protein [Eubacteriales bacterium]|nr:nucleotidyltransferase family protein [Eubacteriales bacterium]
MRAAGIIAEYNPFHNGHERHIRETRRITGCDVLIVAMNGSVSQRGEVMLLDKWTRAEMALRGGADLVVELPVLWGARPAENFAFGGVALLHALGCRWLSFGCETDDLPLLLRLAEVMENEPEEYAAALRRALSEGKSFVRARAEALSLYTGAAEELLQAPNAALGLEYIRAIRRLGSWMQPVLVRRGASHHAQELASETSASAIRAAVYAGRLREAAVAMPAQAFALLEQNAGSVPSPELVDVAALGTLRALTPEQIARLPDVGEGLENALAKACRTAGTRAQLLENVKSKRYTHARLSRIAAHAMLKTDRGLLTKFPAPPYARVLGVRRAVVGELSELQNNSALPLVMRGKALEGDECFALERTATDLRALLSRRPGCRSADADLTHRLLVVD